MRLTLLAVSAAIAMAGCTTVAKYSLKSDLQRIGLSESMSGCMADQLEDRLEGGDLQELALHVRSLTRANNNAAALSAIKKIDNPRVIAAATASALSCALAPNN